jgi:D-3-phosphoglycerate dehydrogenase / 2-oxoglutarate reductase
MAMYKILISAPYLIPHIERFRTIFDHYQLEWIIPQVHERLSEEEILVHAGKFDGTICGDDRYTERALEGCAPRLKVIAKWGTGIDSIDRQAALKFGIQVRNTPNAFTLPVADTVMGYILAFARKQPWMDHDMKGGRWEKINGHSLSEKILGVIGLGNIGKAVMRRARGFGMKLLGTDIIPIAPDFLLENGVEMTTLKDLLSRADYVSINCDLNLTSHHLMRAETLAWMKKDAVLINTARGPIIEEPDLVKVLQEKQIAGAALDVFEVEPLPLTSPFLKMDQVMLAAHNANSSPAAWERVHWNTLRNLLEGLNIPCDDLNTL